jgi:leader peptidase (prepilin peptidase)/N-methyltransferase
MTPAVLLVHLLFLFALGACVGSFLNVVVWRLPRGESLVSPPSHCPKCNHKLAWYDNVPVFGWLALKGKCRYCKAPISARYPTIEFITGALFVLYYVLFFIVQVGPAPAQPTFVTDLSGTTVLNPLNPIDHWPILAIYLFMLSCLLAASLIDLELFIIPIEIPYLLAAVAIIGHALVDRPRMPGALNASAPEAMLAAGAAIGLAISVGLWFAGVMPTSFAQGEPLLDVDREQMAKETESAKREGKVLEYDAQHLPPDYSVGQIRGEILKEMLFLLPPVVLGLLGVVLYKHTTVGQEWGNALASSLPASGFLGALLGAMVGAFIVWVTRILGTLGFGRVAMGLGDVHLMFGVGAAIGGGRATVAFFVAPFFGLLIAAWSAFTKKRREIPYGPYLSLGAAVSVFIYEPVKVWLGPGLGGLADMLYSLL